MEFPTTLTWYDYIKLEKMIPTPESTQVYYFQDLDQRLEDTNNLLYQGFLSINKALGQINGTIEASSKEIRELGEIRNKTLEQMESSIQNPLRTECNELADIAYNLIKNGLYTEGKLYIDKALQLHPAHDKSTLLLSLLYYKYNLTSPEEDTAEQLFERTIRLTQDREVLTTCHYYLGIIHFDKIMTTEDPQEAEISYQHLKNIPEKYPLDDKVGEIHYKLGFLKGLLTAYGLREFGIKKVTYHFNEIFTKDLIELTSPFLEELRSLPGNHPLRSIEGFNEYIRNKLTFQELQEELEKKRQEREEKQLEKKRQEEEKKRQEEEDKRIRIEKEESNQEKYGIRSCPKCVLSIDFEEVRLPKIEAQLKDTPRLDLSFFEVLFGELFGSRFLNDGKDLHEIRGKCPECGRTVKYNFKNTSIPKFMGIRDFLEHALDPQLYDFKCECGDFSHFEFETIGIRQAITTNGYLYCPICHLRLPKEYKESQDKINRCPHCYYPVLEGEVDVENMKKKIEGSKLRDYCRGDYTYLQCKSCKKVIG